MKCPRCNEYHTSACHPRGQRVDVPWADEKECDDDDTDLGPEDGWKKNVDDRTFHLAAYDSRRREMKPLEKLVCVQCGGDKFQVGSGDWTTAAKCCGCGWEAVVHEG